MSASKTNPISSPSVTVPFAGPNCIAAPHALPNPPAPDLRQRDAPVVVLVPAGRLRLRRRGGPGLGGAGRQVEFRVEVDPAGADPFRLTGRLAPGAPDAGLFTA